MVAPQLLSVFWSMSAGIRPFSMIGFRFCRTPSTSRAR